MKKMLTPNLNVFAAAKNSKMIKFSIWFINS